MSFRSVAPAWSFILRARILAIDFLQFYSIKLIFFTKHNVFVLVSSIWATNMSSYRHIHVPKREILELNINNLGWFGPKPYIKRPKAHKKNDCLVTIIKREKLSCFDLWQTWWHFWLEKRKINIIWMIFLFFNLIDQF